MSEMDDLEARILGLARNELTLSAEHKERHLVALQSAITVGVGPRLTTDETLTQSAPPAPAPGAPAATAPWVKGVAAKLVAWSAISALVGAALGFAAGYRMGALPNATPNQNQPVAPPASAPLVTSLPVPTPSSAVVAPEPTPSNTSNEAVHQPTRHAEKPEAAVPTRAANPNEAPPNQSEVERLQEELSYLRRAQNALGSGDPQRALGLVRSLDEQMPTGRMLPEREVTRILSLCALGAHEEARSRGRTFLQSYGETLYAERVRRSCASETETSITQH
jgi:hypothetical protein